MKSIREKTAMTFWKKFRNEPVRKRRKSISSNLLGPENEKRTDFSFTGFDEDLLDLSEVMIEQAIGYIGVPLGLAGPFTIDDREIRIPMATEEPSVIAAASFAGRLLSKHGGIRTQSTEPVMVAQVFLEGNLDLSSVEKVLSSRGSIKQHLQKTLESMESRGGGWRSIDARWIAPSKTLAVNIQVDVRDSMGANLLNSVAEKVRPVLERITGGKVLMAILSNRSWDRTASARLSISTDEIGSVGFNGRETARRIVRAARVAREDFDRAITHNKGIMNGISALALATGNDTRAIEAAVHAYAARYGPYHGLSQYWIEENTLHGSLELPLPFAVTGGAVKFHPTSRWSLEQLGNPDGPGLSRIAAALGLVQNLAALRALVCEGIQRGHMNFHARRLAYNAGARGDGIPAFTAVICSENIRSREAAAKRFTAWREQINAESG